MRTWKRVAAILSVCLITGAFGQQVQRSTVLPMSEAKAVATRFPKRGPNRISGAWELTKADIDSLEVDLILQLYLRFMPEKCQEPGPEGHVISCCFRALKRPAPSGIANYNCSTKPDFRAAKEKQGTLDAN
jgi:hypothetical protein